MSRTIAFAINGIARADIGGHPSPHARTLLHALADERYRLAALHDDAHSDTVARWLATEGFPTVHYYQGRAIGDPDGPQRRALQLRRLVQQGCTIDFVLECDPTNSAYLMGQGHRILHLMNPPFARPEFRPDYDGTMRPWDEIVTSTDHLRELRAHAPGEADL